MLSKRLLAVAVLLVLGVHLVGLGRAHVLEPDEGRYADVARNFLHGGDLVVPRADGVPFLDKPPLVPWAGALSMKLLGETALALRLVPALSGVLAALVAAAFAHALYRRGGWAAALVYGCAPLALGLGRTFTLDVPLTALTSLGVLLILGGAGVLEAIRPSHLLSVLGGLAIGLATLVKGPVAIGLAGLATLAALAVAPSRRLFSPLPWLAALAVSAPWYVLVARAEPALARAFFIEENLLRFAGPPVEHIRSVAFFPVTLLWGLGGGTLAGLVLLGTKPPLPRGGLALVLYAFAVVGFFSLSSTKVETYILPVFPLLAGVIGGELELALEERAGPVWRGLRACFFVLVAGLALACAGFAGFALGWLPVRADYAEEIRAASSPVLALLPLGALAAALVAARSGKPRAALLATGGAGLLILVAILGPLERISYLKSAEPAAELVREGRARAPGAALASYYSYYRGLPFFVGEPITLLGEYSELKVAAFADRPDLAMPDIYFNVPGGARREDCWTRSFLVWKKPVLVVMPGGQHRPERFLDACQRAGVKATFVDHRGEDVLFLVKDAP